jgi:hypothetical protein
MPTDNSLSDVFNQVVYDNNAQEVFKKLNDLDNKRDVLVSRWVWELIQNARGTAGSQNTLQIEVVLDRDQLVFRHNGAPFKDREIAHLIYHGSSKHDPKDIGKFGSGFITTHLLSRRVRVRGTLSDGRPFDFILNRDGKDAPELRFAMEQSKEDFIASLDRKPEAVPAPFTTEYAYPLNESIREVVLKGIESLRRSAAYIFAFNSMLQRLKISTPDGPVDLTRRELEPLFPGSRYQGLCLNAQEPKQWLVTLSENNVEAAMALEASGENFAVQLPVGVPRLFVAFPLNNTENFGLPLVLNSELFAPPEDRDGIYLGTSENEINAKNKELFIVGCQTIVRQISHAAQQSWSNTASATSIQPFANPSWANGDWLRVQIREVLIQGFRTEKLLRTVSGSIIAPQSAWIPISQNSASSKELWHITGQLKIAADLLPCAQDQEAWGQSLQSWLPFLQPVAPNPKEIWSVEKLAVHLEGLKSVSGVTAALETGQDAIAWINAVHALIVKAGCFELFRQRALIPNEKGNFVSLNSLHLHDKIDETLKDIAEQLDYPIRANLIHSDITSQDIQKALSTYTEASLVTKTLELIRTRFPEHPLPVAVRSASVKFFGWLLTRNQTVHLDNYPVLSQVDSVENAMSRLKLHANAEEKQRWLAPIAFWPDPAKEFSDLFSDKVILHPDYADACANLESWEKLQSNGYLRLAPFFESESKVSDFLPDLPLSPEEEKSKPSSETTLTRSEIPFLTGEDHSVLNRARGSAKKAIKVLKFLSDFILDADPNAFEVVTTKCDNGKEHRFYRAAWLTSLRNRWVPAGEGRLEPTAQSMATLLSEEPELLKRLSDPRIAQLFTIMGASPAELLLRTVGKDDPERMSLIQTLTQLNKAAGNDPEKLKAFAGAVEQDSEVFRFALERQQHRETVKRNQALGALVESLFEQAFAGTDLVPKRTGPGHDYLIKIAEDEEQDVGGIEVKGPHGKVYVEIKATTTGVARMSELQVKEAVANKDRYFLCVVAVTSTVLGMEDFKSQARFVTNIGELFQNLWAEYTSMNLAVRKTKTEDSGLAIELSDQQAKFRVDKTVWQAGSNFENVIAEFKSRLTSK